MRDELSTNICGNMATFLVYLSFLFLNSVFFLSHHRIMSNYVMANKELREYVGPLSPRKDIEFDKGVPRPTRPLSWYSRLGHEIPIKPKSIQTEQRQRKSHQLIAMVLNRCPKI